MYRILLKTALICRNVFYSLALLAIIPAYISFTTSFPKSEIGTYNDAVQQTGDYYRTQLAELDEITTFMEQSVEKMDKNSLQKRFKEARLIYKKIEWLVEYQFRETALKLNAPNLLEAIAHTPNEPVYPTGFQVLEEVLFDAEGYDKKQAKVEVNSLQFGVNRLKNSMQELELTDARILHAIRLNWYRMMMKGITGFDSPVALYSLPEALATLESSKQILSFFKNTDKVLACNDKASNYLKNYTGTFDDFNRMEFITKFINPLCDALHEYQTQNGIPYVTDPRSAINSKASNLFSKNAFDISFFAPSDALALTDENIALGERLFYDNNLSIDQSRNCASCHHPDKGFTDGLRVNESLDKRINLLRNTPTLLNSGLQAAQFLDGRVHHLEDQAHAVITNSNEMGGDFSTIQNRLSVDKMYRAEFKKTFGKNGITERNIKLALGAYVRSLSSLDSRFDAYMQGEIAAMNQEEINGFNLFMGKAKCATCHFVPLFNGSAPPFYDKAESEVLGIPNQVEKNGAQLDSDLGKYQVYGIPHQKHSFKTTTVRNASITGPYMHNGVFSTLEEVIDFYNEGGGAAYGFDLPNQTLPGDKLNLSDEEKQNLVKFMKALENKKQVKTPLE
jgi:cytochrome c peroxidase